MPQRPCISSLQMAQKCFIDDGKGREGTVQFSFAAHHDILFYEQQRRRWIISTAAAKLCDTSMYITGTIPYGTTHARRRCLAICWRNNMHEIKIWSHVHCLVIIQLPNPPIGELNVQNTPGMITKNFHANNSRDTTTHKYIQIGDPYCKIRTSTGPMETTKS